MDQKKVKAFAISFIVTGVLIGILAYTISWSEVYQELLKVSYIYLIPGTLVIFSQMLIRALRWRFLLAGGEKTTLWQRFGALMMGSLATFILPLRAGEFIRPLYLSQKGAVGFVPCFVSVVIERFFDLAAVLVLFVVGTFVLPTLPTDAKVAASSFLLPAIVILAVAVVGAFSPNRIRAISDFILSRIPEKLSVSLKKLREDFLTGVSVLKSAWAWSAILIGTAVLWSSAIYGYYVLLPLVLEHSDIKLSLALTVISALAVALPSMPGFIGVYQWACIGSFALLGLPKEQAVTFSIVTHIHQYVIFIVTGGIVFIIDKFFHGTTNVEKNL